MVTQITLKTEGPHGLPSDRLPAEVDLPCGEVLFHLSRLRLRPRFTPERVSQCASALTRESGVGRTTPGQGLRIKRRVTARFSVEVSLAGIEPVGLRVKSDLRNHRAIVQPRLYDCSMVTQITLQ